MSRIHGNRISEPEQIDNSYSHISLCLGGGGCVLVFVAEVHRFQRSVGHYHPRPTAAALTWSCVDDPSSEILSSQRKALAKSLDNINIDVWVIFTRYAETSCGTGNYVISRSAENV